MKYLILVTFMVMTHSLSWAQGTVEVAMDKGWVTNGKMYVVVLCVLVLLLILLAFLFNLDRKLKKIEKKLFDKK